MEDGEEESSSFATSGDGIDEDVFSGENERDGLFLDFGWVDVLQVGECPEESFSQLKLLEGGILAEDGSLVVVLVFLILDIDFLDLFFFFFLFFLRVQLGVFVLACESPLLLFDFLLEGGCLGLVLVGVLGDLLGDGESVGLVGGSGSEQSVEEIVLSGDQAERLIVIYDVVDSVHELK